MDVLAFQPLWTWLMANLWAEIAIIIVAAYFVSGLGELLIRPIVHLGVQRRKSDIDESDVKKRRDTMVALLRTLLKVVAWTAALLYIVHVSKIDLGPLLAGAGLAGLAIGFGAQSIIKDFISGLFIIFENQYRVGDTVTLGNSTGVVEEITVRSTILRDFDGNVHFVPNGTIGEVVNKTLGFSKINLTIQVKPDTNIDRLTEIINKVGTDMNNDKTWAKSIIQPPQFS
ncbi:MAG TPA: mechanosensitive ion channel domain-containing protein, partial [Candidatus Acidoferrum sp.]|nr:mechanosensitive ion channel domain-containing protein [Candidatus Acidoferrum sp.]